MKQYVIKNENLKVTILSYGAIIQKIEMPDKNGNWENIVLGFESPEEYVTKNAVYFGAVVGRTAGRTENAVLKIGDRFFPLDKNANGKHSIHGGKDSISHREWEGRQEGNKVILCIDSPDLDNGYPGKAKIQVVYSLEGETLKIHYFAESDQDTYFNMTNHTYFSLSGKQNKDIGNQYLTLRAKEYMKVNGETLPMSISSVEGTPFDFQKPKKLETIFGNADEQIQIVGDGIDHPFLTNYAKLEDKESGRILEVETTNHGVVIYTANWLHTIGRKDHTGICFEAQEIPSLFKFKPKEYKVGKKYERMTTFRFYLDFGMQK